MYFLFELGISKHFPRRLYMKSITIYIVSMYEYMYVSQKLTEEVFSSKVLCTSMAYYL